MGTCREIFRADCEVGMLLSRQTENVDDAEDASGEDAERDCELVDDAERTAVVERSDLGEVHRSDHVGDPWGITKNKTIPNCRQCESLDPLKFASDLNEFRTADDQE